MALRTSPRISSSVIFSISIFGPSIPPIIASFPSVIFLNFNNIILGDHPLPDIHADLHHICHNRLADAVRVVYIDHAAFMDGIRDFLLQRFDNRPPDSGRQKQILFGNPSRHDRR